jgi:hypothetical protein
MGGLRMADNYTVSVQHTALQTASSDVAVAPCWRGDAPVGNEHTT